MRTYIITDPSYIMSGANWEKYCQALEDSNQNAPACNALLSELLRVPAMADRTGYGDWGNVLNCEEGEDHVLREEFCADAGMVCCCEFTDGVRKKLEHCCRDSEGLAAVFESRGVEDVLFDTSRADWTVVHIRGAEGETSSAESPREAQMKLGKRDI